MIGSEWENDEGTIIKIVGESLEGGWTYRYLQVRCRPTRSQKTKTISDPVLRQHYTRRVPSGTAQRTSEPGHDES